MIYELYTTSRDGLYDARATYDGNIVVVKKGSLINMANKKGFKPSKEVLNKRFDKEIVTEDKMLCKDVEFSSLSAAASFVTGRVANGLIVWKTMDGKNIKKLLKN